MSIRDIIIIGAGPAGLTAAVYALRAGKNCLLIEKAAFGGQITYSPKVENFPTIKQISGTELADRMVDAAIELGAEFESDTVVEIINQGTYKTVVCRGGSYDCRAVIIATGVKHRMLGLEGEEELVGSGISFCAVCDGAFYRDEAVAVAGGGNTALQEAVYLSDFCKQVYVIEVMPEFTGEKALLELLSQKDNVTLLSGTKITALNSEGGLNGIEIENASGQREALSVSGLFVAIGLVPDNGSFCELARLDGRGYFDSGEDCSTDTPGIYVAGDCRKKDVRQLTTACADGSVAALSACKFLDKHCCF